MRTGVSALGCVEPERDQSPEHARDIADRLIASLGSMLLYWHHFARSGARIDVESDADSVGAHFLTLLHRRPPPASWVRAMHTSLVLYAEHEFNASTFTARVIAGTGSDLYSCIAGGIGALRGPKHGGANEVALEIQQRYRTPEEAVADIRARLARKEVVIGFGHPVYTVADPRNRIIKDVARRLSEEAGDLTLFRDRRRDRSGDGGGEEDVREPRLVLGRRLSRHGRADARCSRRCSSSRARRAGPRTSSSNAPTARSFGRARTTSAPRTAASCRSPNAESGRLLMARAGRRRWRTPGKEIRRPSHAPRRRWAA